MAEMLADKNPAFAKSYEDAMKDTITLSKDDKKFFKLLSSEAVINVRVTALPEKQSVLFLGRTNFDTVENQANGEMTRCKVFDGDNWGCLDWWKTDRDSSGWMATTDSIIMTKGRLHFASKGRPSALKCESHAQFSAPLKSKFAWLTKW